MPKCIWGEQKQLECKAEVIGRYLPADAPEYELKQCEIDYQKRFCY